MAAQNEVELIIRAKNLSTKTITQLNGELNQIAENQEKVADANKLAERSFESLKAEQNQLLAVMKNVSDRAAKLGIFDRQKQEVAQLSQELTKARGVLSAMATEFYNTEKPTKEFVDQMRRADSNVGKLEIRLGKAQGRLEKTGAKLREMGIDGAQFSKAQEDINRSLEQSLRLYKQATDNVERYDAAVSRAKANAATAGFRASGSQALAQARGLAVTGGSGGASLGAAAAGVQAVLDPAKEAVATLDRLEKEVDQLGTEFKALSPELLESAEGMERLADQSRRLREASLALKNQASLADELAKSNAALQTSKQEFEQARRAVILYAQAVEQADTPNEELAASLVRAQNALKQSFADFQRQSDAFAKVEARARAAGVTVAQLAGIEERLARTATQVRSGQDQVAQSMVRLEQNTKRTTAQFNAFNNSQRTALSLYQRSRGQVLSLVASYAGLFGAINLANQSIDATVQREKILARLRVASKGDTRAAAEEFDYLRNKADELGVVFGPLAESYSRFAVAARDAGQSSEATRFIFESFTEAAAALRLSGDETAGTFKALEQIFSKGFIQAEELRGQLGDRLTGAFNLFAKAIGVSTKELNDMLEAGGKVRAEFVLLAAQQARGIYGEEAKNASDSFIGDMARLQNAFDDVKRAIIDGGFGDALRDLFQDLTRFFKSNEGEKFAANLSKAFTSAAIGLGSLVETLANSEEAITFAADAVAFLARNLKTLLGLYVAIEASKIIIFFASFTAQLVLARKAAVGLNTALAVGTVASSGKAGAAVAGLISGPIAALIAIAAAGIIIPIVLQIREEKFQAEIKKQSENLMTRLDEGFRSSIEGLNAQRSTAEVLERQVKAAENLLGVYDREKAALQERIRLNTEARKQQAAIRVAQGSREGDMRLPEKQFAAMRRVEEEGSKLEQELIQLDVLANAVRAQVGFAQTDLKAMAQETKSVEGDALAAELKRLRALADSLSTGGDAKGAKAAAAALKKLEQDRIRLAKETADTIRQIDDDLLAAQDENVDNRIALIRSEFQVRRNEILALIEEAKKLGLGDEAARLQASLVRLQTLQTITETKTRTDFNAERVAANEQKINDLLAQRQLELETNNLLVEAGLRTQLESAETIEATNARLLPQMNQLVLEAQEFINTLSGEEAVKAQLALDNIKASVAAVGAELSAQQLQIVDLFANTFGDIFMQTTQLLGEVIKGTKSAGEAWESFGDIVLNSIAQILSELARMLIMQALFNALKNAASGAGGGVWGGIINGLANLLGGKMHSGGLVGAGGAQPMRVPAYVFANAPRYHSGGIAGMKPDEVATVLQRNEEVLTEDDPRHRFNGGGASGAPIVKLTNVNTFDIQEVAGMVLQSAAFGPAVVNAVNKNATAIKQRLRS
jgi:tape measure domain-containing protein